MSSLPSPGNLQRTYTTCSPFLTLYLSDSWGQLPSPATVWRCHPWPHCQHTSGLTSPQRTGYSHPPLQHSNWVFTSTPATQRLGIHIHPCNTAIRYVYPVPHSTPCFPNSARIGYAEFNVALHPQIQTIMDGKLRMATSTFTHLLSSVGYATDGVLFISAHVSKQAHTVPHSKPGFLASYSKLCLNWLRHWRGLFISSTVHRCCQHSPKGWDTNESVKAT